MIWLKNCSFGIEQQLHIQNIAEKLLKVVLDTINHKSVNQNINVLYIHLQMKTDQIL